MDYKQPDQKPLLTKVRASGADMVYLAGVVDTGAPIILRQMKDLGLVAARGVRLIGPDGLYEEEVLKAGTCDAAIGTEMRITFASLPFEKMKGIGATTYENYKKKYGKEPTGYALYSAEAARIAIDGIKRAAADIEKGANPMAKREAVRKAIAGAQELRRAERQVQLRRERRHHARDHVRVQGREERQGARLHVPVRVHPRIGD